MSYRELKDIIREQAIRFQKTFDECTYTWSELAEIAAYFEKYGARYGLLQEFRENGIL